MKPKIIRRPSIVPLPLREETKRQLDEDVKKNIIRKCPENQHPIINNRMYVVPKPNGGVRRTIDMRFLNLQCSRELSYTTPPFQKVQDIPQNTWKSVRDAEKGYHSMPIAEESKHLTTFITEWGTYEYNVLPQGYIT